MGGDDAPTPTDPRTVIEAQQGANTQALQQSQAANQVNQQNTVGNRSWQLLGYDQNGNPRYGMTEALNPQEQSLYNMFTNSRGASGQTGNALWDSIMNSGAYNQPFDPINDVNAGVNTRMTQMQNYMDPFLTKQRQDRDNEMRNQGLTPGMEGYDEEMNRVQDQQQQSIQALLAQFQPEAFKQAYQQHEQPLSEAYSLANFGKNNPLSFSNTPQYAQNAADATGAYRTYDQQQLAAWEQQQRQNSGFWQGLGAIGGAVLGGPVGSYIGSGIGGMFGPSVGSSYNPSWNTTTSYG